MEHSIKKKNIKKKDIWFVDDFSEHLTSDQVAKAWGVPGWIGNGTFFSEAGGGPWRFFVFFFATKT